MTAVLPCAPTTDLPDLPELVGADLRVPLVTGGWVRAANLDLAASAPALRAVADHVAELLPLHASVHRGAGYASQVCTAVVERGRDAVAAFVGAREDDVVVWTRNTTDALNLLAACVPGPVLRLDLEHHATLLAWRSGRVLQTAPTVEQTLDGLARALVEERFALVAVTGASNVTGEVPPLRRIVELAHAAGARVVVDAAQLAPHRRVDLAATGADYLALSGHKLYAPYGAGALVGRRDWLDAAEPYLAGGGAVTAVGAVDATGDTPATWAPAPHRHEAGTPNVLGVAALARACRVLDGVVDTIAPAHERALLARLGEGLATVAGVRPLRIWPDAADRVAVVSFTVDGVAPGLVAAYLSAEHGIAVRDGKFCAHPLVDRAAGAGGAVRASFGLAGTTEDVDRLVGALRELVERGPRWDYAVVDGRWAPTPDPRDLDPLGVGRAGGTPSCGSR
ncbi:aminotransferase class V-fold PLP-dependent enzyme [Pseudonocardia humida]|uniref:Aminotransferase class V-fold PLP-dependent enzyme n=1 Tax=Pseudonocardia humida TaxID=2800819 RepID=A0ABT1AB66_9PSEU|nr:aminotransferase class V-fold PLP-dependent enzyme [Pseudonocardia humida]MCO1660206.1 aminotransferase class V-fold PLP-dependent enzyme [Pseudonocardia humida]